MSFVFVKGDLKLGLVLGEFSVVGLQKIGSDLRNVSRPLFHGLPSGQQGMHLVSEFRLTEGCRTAIAFVVSASILNLTARLCGSARVYPTKMSPDLTQHARNMV
jgi:hypothetical protein